MAGGVEFRRASERASYLTTWTDLTTCGQQQPVEDEVRPQLLKKGSLLNPFKGL
jgi:hypothetical protein